MSPFVFMMLDGVSTNCSLVLKAKLTQFSVFDIARKEFAQSIGIDCAIELKPLLGCVL